MTLNAASLPPEAMSEEPPESLIPYDEIVQEALRDVVGRVLGEVELTGVLPGGHHFYITFRTDHPGVSIPARLKAQYPEEMTIVIQHQFWDLIVDEAAGFMSIGLSFGGVPATLRIPFAAMSAFADPYVRHGMRFKVIEPEGAPKSAEPVVEIAAEPAPEPAPEQPQVVSLDAFRRRPPPKS